MDIGIRVDRYLHLGNRDLTGDGSLTSEDLDRPGSDLGRMVSIWMIAPQYSLERDRVSELIEGTIWIDIEVVSRGGIHP